MAGKHGWTGELPGWVFATGGKAGRSARSTLALLHTGTAPTLALIPTSAESQAIILPGLSLE
jgi:hypothetical protein